MFHFVDLQIYCYFSKNEKDPVYSLQFTGIIFIRLLYDDARTGCLRP